MNRHYAALLYAAALLSIAGPAPAQSAPAHTKGPWMRLFDGKTLNGWMTSSGTPSRTPVEDGSINPHRSGGYMMIHRNTWADFELELEFKISRGCNSGVFLRTWPLTVQPGRDVGYNGLEIAVDDTTGAGYHDTGALYDLAKPTRNAMKPAGEWNRMRVLCAGPYIEVELNGEVVNRIDLDAFTTAGLRPDGTRHKFGSIVRDHPRSGYIGLQDHGSPCWYRNIRLRSVTVLPVRS
jgi:hypothetical protein